MSNLKTPPPKTDKGFKRHFTVLENFMDSANQITILIAVRRGLVLMIPLMLVGSLAIFVNAFPNEAYQRAMRSVFGENWTNFGGFIRQATFGIASLGVNLTVGYSLVAHRREKIQDIHPMMGALTAICCLFTLTHTGESFVNWLGTRGIFVSLFAAIAGTGIYMALCKIKKLRINLLMSAANSNLNAAVSTMIPFAITLSIFALIRVMFGMVGVEDIHAAMYEGLSGLFYNADSPLSTGIILQALIQGFWFLGVHGTQAFVAVENEVLEPALMKNIELVAQGLPPTEIINIQFFNTFVYLGGSGATICLIIAIFIAVRRSNIRRVAGVGVLPAIINVNEIITYGVPIVLNFFLMVPMIIIPIVLTIITYLAMALEIVPLAAAQLDWTTPVIMGGYMATGGSIAGLLLQVFNLAVGTLIYLPFVRLYENSLNRDNKRALIGLMDTVHNINDLRRTVLLDRRDAAGNMARALAVDIPSAMQSDELYLNYQPLVNEEGIVFSVEALLRWNHKQLGYIPPPVVIAVAEESGNIHDLGMWIFDTAVKALKDFRDNGANIDISINITPSQLDNPSFAEEVMEIAKKYDIDPKLIEIEITEQTALGGLHRVQIIRDMRELGFRFAIDDFGMGHGSLTYLKDLDLDVIKIDGALVRDIETNSSCRDIISTITSLGTSMDIRVIAEFVENEQQRGLLQGLGCTHYQGYLYSPALPLEAATRYILERNKGLVKK